MQKITSALLVALLFAVIIPLSAQAASLTTVHTASLASAVHPDGTCGMEQWKSLYHPTNDLTVTTTLTCSPNLVIGFLSATTQHCSFAVFDLCIVHDITVPIFTDCPVTATRPSCTGTGIIEAAGRWDTTTKARAETSDGGIGAGSMLFESIIFRTSTITFRSTSLFKM